MLKLLTIFSLLISSLFARSETLIPEDVISKLLEKYNSEEKQLIEADLNLIRELVFRGRSSKKYPYYIATAGAPLNRKTTILEKVISEETDYQNTVYLDPDQRALKFMVNTYIARSFNNLEIYKKKDMQKVRSDAYDYWRDASNYITNTLLNEAFEKRYDIAHGTTMTGEHSAVFLQKLKNAGYRVELLVCYASQGFRRAAYEFRNEKQGFYQNSPEDFIEKKKLFDERFETYSTIPHRMRSYLSVSFGEPIKPSAICPSQTLCQINLD